MSKKNKVEVKVKSLVKYKNTLNNPTSYISMYKGLTAFDIDVFTVVLAQFSSKKLMDDPIGTDVRDVKLLTETKTFALSDFKRLMNFNKNITYHDFGVKFAKSLAKISSIVNKTEIYDDSGEKTKTILTPLFNQIEIHEKEKMISIKLNPSFCFLFEGLKKNFTLFSLEQSTPIKNVTAKKLLPLLKQYKYLGGREFDIDTLKELLRESKSYVIGQQLQRAYAELATIFYHLKFQKIEGTTSTGRKGTVAYKASWEKIPKNTQDSFQRLMIEEYIYNDIIDESLKLIKVATNQHLDLKTKLSLADKINGLKRNNTAKFYGFEKAEKEEKTANNIKSIFYSTNYNPASKTEVPINGKYFRNRLNDVASTLSVDQLTKLIDIYRVLDDHQLLKDLDIYDLNALEIEKEKRNK